MFGPCQGCYQLASASPFAEPAGPHLPSVREGQQTEGFGKEKENKPCVSYPEQMQKERTHLLQFHVVQVERLQVSPEGLEGAVGDDLDWVMRKLEFLQHPQLTHRVHGIVAQLVLVQVEDSEVFYVLQGPGQEVGEGVVREEEPTQVFSPIEGSWFKLPDFIAAQVQDEEVDKRGEEPFW